MSRTTPSDDVSSAVALAEQPDMHKEMEELLPSKSAANLRRYMGGRTKTMPNDVPELTMDEIHDLVHELRP